MTLIVKYFLQKPRKNNLGKLKTKVLHSRMPQYNIVRNLLRSEAESKAFLEQNQLGFGQGCVTLSLLSDPSLTAVKKLKHSLCFTEPIEVLS